MTLPLTGKPTASPWKPKSTELTSDTSSHPDNTLNTPDFTPVDTPSIGQPATNLELLNKVIRMDEVARTDDTKVEGSGTKEASQLQPSTIQEEKAPPNAKKPCKKHDSTKEKIKKSKRSKSMKDASSDGDSSSSSLSSESDLSDSSDSSSEEDETSKRRRRKKAKKIKEKKAALRKAKGKKKKKQKTVDSSDDSDSTSDSSTDEEEKRKAKKKKAKARAKKVAEEAAEEGEQADDDESNARAQLAQLQALNLRRNLAGNRRISRVPGDLIPKTTDTKTKKKKIDPNNPDYFRVDQLWDKTIHNYKLTETADRSNEDEFGR